MSKYIEDQLKLINDEIFQAELDAAALMYGLKKRRDLLIKAAEMLNPSDLGLKDILDAAKDAELV